MFPESEGVVGVCVSEDHLQPTSTWVLLLINLVWLSLGFVSGIFFLCYTREYTTDRKINGLESLLHSTASRISTLAAGKSESAEWMNNLLGNLWSAGLLSNFELQLRATLESKLQHVMDARYEENTNQKVPTWIDSIKVESFSLGRRCPTITSVNLLDYDPDNGKTELELGLSLQTESMAVHIGCQVKSGLHSLLDKYDLLTASGADSELHIQVNGMKMVGVVKVEVQTKSGLMMWGLLKKPTCQMNLDLQARAGSLELSVPVSSFPKVMEFLEGIVTRDLAEDLMWPRFTVTNILNPQAPPPLWRGVMEVKVMAISGILHHLPAKGSATLKYTCTWAGSLKRASGTLAVPHTACKMETITWNDTFEVALYEDTESLLFEVSIQHEGTLSSWTSVATSATTIPLGSNRLKVLGLPEGGSIIYTTTVDGSQSIVGISPECGETVDMKRRSSLQIGSEIGIGKIEIPLLSVDSSDSNAETTEYVDKGCRLKVCCKTQWKQGA